MSRLFISLIVLSFFTQSLFSQAENNPEKPSDENREEILKKNQASYLEKAQYRNISFVFKDKLLSDLRDLSVIVGNFGEQVPGSKESFEKLKKDYQNSVRYHYRRAYVISGKNFLEMYKESQDLFKKFAELYEKQAEDLIIQVADDITKIETANLEEPEPDPRKSRLRDLEEARFKLKIASFQISQGDEMILDKRYADSLVHFRLAKDFALKIISDLEKDKEAREKRMEEYKIHLADNRNRVASASNQTDTNQP